ncbi:MAG: uroporphyrinogen-III synthase, partial [Methanomassiliicoccales archaeon]
MLVALLRPEPRTTEALEYCKRLGLRAVVAPALGIRFREIDAVAVMSSLEKADTVIFMSVTAVEALSSASPVLIEKCRGRMVVAVGKATA